jgi:hypothetical protein
MTGTELINRGSCGGDSGSLGSNLSGGCLHILKAAASIWAISPSTDLDPSEDWSVLSYWQTLQAQGKLVVLKGVTSFEENGSDDAIETEEDDTQEVTNEGKYTFLATFKKGLFNNRVLHSLKGFGGWKFIIVDKAGSILMTQNSTGFGRGFNVGMIQPAKLTFPTTTTSLKEGLRFQLLDRFELDENYVLIDKNNLSFDPRVVDGVTEVKLSFVNAPSNTDTSVRVSAVRSQDNKTAIEDLEFGDFLFVNGISTTNPSADAAVAGEPSQYDLTGITALATSDSVTLRIYDNANNRAIVNKNGNLYKSATIAATVVA